MKDPGQEMRTYIDRMNEVSYGGPEYDLRSAVVKEAQLLAQMVGDISLPQHDFDSYKKSDSTKFVKDLQKIQLEIRKVQTLVKRVQ